MIPAPRTRSKSIQKQPKFEHCESDSDFEENVETKLITDENIEVIYETPIRKSHDEEIPEEKGVEKIEGQIPDESQEKDIEKLEFDNSVKLTEDTEKPTKDILDIEIIEEPAVEATEKPDLLFTEERPAQNSQPEESEKIQEEFTGELNDQESEKLEVKLPEKQEEVIPEKKELHEERPEAEGCKNLIIEETENHTNETSDIDLSKKSEDVQIVKSEESTEIYSDAEGELKDNRENSETNENLVSNLVQKRVATILPETIVIEESVNTAEIRDRSNLNDESELKTGISEILNPEPEAKVSQETELEKEVAKAKIEEYHQNATLPHNSTLDENEFFKDTLVSPRSQKIDDKMIESEIQENFEKTIDISLFSENITVMILIIIIIQTFSRECSQSFKRKNL